MPRSSSAASSAPGSADRPAQVGDYTLLTKLGEGGMGIVHLARSGTGERVALKVLRPQVVGDDEGRARLAREVGSLSRVRSEWVAEILDADPWAPVPYIATRYVAGPSLHDLITDSGLLAGADLVWFARCLARGVAAVHDAGVLHRDVKPANVLMEGRTPILIDFGLARVADDPRLTHTGWLIGTPGYLAPEILYGDPATTASDVHSWAATVAFAALGRPPFGRGPSMAIMDRVRRGEHDLSGMDPHVADLLARALDPEPHLRPTLPEVLAELRELDGPDGPDPTEPMPAPTLFAPVEEIVRHARAPRHLDGASRVGPPWTAQGFAPEPAEEPEEPAEPAEWAQEWSQPERPRKATFVEGLRRGLLLTALAATATAGFAAYPLLTLPVVLVVVWLLRGGSLGASAIDNRRMLRGRRWYDAPWAALRSPWDLLRSVPGSILLALWSVGLALAAALLCFAAAATQEVTLAAGGAVFVGGLWLGPGSSRVRRPVRRIVHRLSRRWPVWVVVGLAVLAAAGALALGATDGADWAPLEERPLSGRLGDLIGGGVAPW